ncbi:fasciclin domain-containing protein [Algoriphagus namhaensis]
MKKLGSILMVAIVLFASSFTTKNENVHEIEADIVDLAISQDFLSTLVAAVKAGDLVDVLKGDGPFTVFAPTNDAFAKLPAGTVENLLKPENKDKLVAVLTYHVVPGKVMSGDLSNGMKATTVQGSDVTITLKDGKAMVNDATVTAADIEADNGVVHVIDTVILPPM